MDLRLLKEESEFLSNLFKVQFISKNNFFEYFKDTIDTFPGFLIPQQFAWKSHLIKYTLDHSRVDNVFWRDSGTVTFGSIEPVFPTY